MEMNFSSDCESTEQLCNDCNSPVLAATAPKPNSGRFGHRPPPRVPQGKRLSASHDRNRTKVTSVTVEDAIDNQVLQSPDSPPHAASNSTVIMSRALSSRSSPVDYSRIPSDAFTSTSAPLCINNSTILACPYALATIIAVLPWLS